MTKSSDQPLAAAPRRQSLPAQALHFLRRFGPAGPLAVAASVLPGLGALLLYGRLSVVAWWLRDHPLAGPLICAAAFAVAGGLVLVPTYALSALCGWSFGFAVGLAAALCGFVAAALVGYTLGRIVDRGRVLTVIDEMPRWRAIRRALATGGLAKVTLVVALVRLAPIAPFSLTNVVMAAAQVPPGAYALGTALGMAPRTAVLVFAASRLSNVDAPLAQEPWLVLSGALLTVAVALALGWIGKTGLEQVAPSANAKG